MQSKNTSPFPPHTILSLAGHQTWGSAPSSKSPSLSIYSEPDLIKALSGFLWAALMGCRALYLSGLLLTFAFRYATLQKWECVSGTGKGEQKAQQRVPWCCWYPKGYPWTTNTPKDTLVPLEPNLPSHWPCFLQGNGDKSIKAPKIASSPQVHEGKTDPSCPSVAPHFRALVGAPEGKTGHSPK